MMLLDFINIAHAQRIVEPNRIDGLISRDGSSLVKYACAAADWIFAIAIILSIAMVIIAGIKYMQSSGDPGKVKEATGRLVWAAVGVAVALIAFTFPMFVSRLIGAGLEKAC
jgi:Na+-driven multidrug efflux pump